MKKSICVLALATIATQPAQAVEITANAGFMSNYMFRGIKQVDSTAMGGFDIKHQGLHAGTWVADVHQGLEVDLYGGYTGSLGAFSYGAGFTGYYYTDNFDDRYQEINLGAGYGIFSLAVAFGQYDNFEGAVLPGNTEPNRHLDYSFIQPRVDYMGCYGLAGLFANDFDGAYYEAGYGSRFESIGLDYRVSVIHTTRFLRGDVSGDGKKDADTQLTVSISRTFRLFP